MRILVLGASGMAGYGIFSILQKYSSHTVYGSTRKENQVNKLNIISGINVYDLKKIDSIILDLKIDCVINCIGLIKQKKDYNNIDFIVVNSLFPHQLAHICSKYKTRLIHLSTDCVFDGSKGNYTENDIVTTNDIYGQSKYCGEVLYDNTLTIRTSIIGKELYSHYSLVEWFLNNKNSSVKGYSNAIFSGFPTTILAHLIKDYVIENKKLEGLYHISSNPINKYDLLNLLASCFKKDILIEKDDSIWCNRTLNSDKFKSITGFRPKNWTAMILNMYNDWDI